MSQSVARYLHLTGRPRPTQVAASHPDLPALRVRPSSLMLPPGEHGCSPSASRVGSPASAFLGSLEGVWDGQALGVSALLFMLSFRVPIFLLTDWGKLLPC